MSRYAATTTVPVERSRAEIERTLQRYGASAFAYGWDGSRQMIQFAAGGRQIRFVLDLPDPQERRFTHHSRGRRTPESANQIWEQACRQKWRALLLVIKAKLEAVEAGITQFEDEFLAHTVLPDGSTVGEWLRPQIAGAYASGRMPGLLAIDPANDPQGA